MSSSCSVSCRSQLPLLSVTFTVRAHLDNMEMINDQPLWPCKLACESVCVARDGGLLEGCHCLAKVEQALLGPRISLSLSLAETQSLHSVSNQNCG